MNYFAHGRRFLHDPYVAAGTAVPDWLRVADRTNRIRGRNVIPWLNCDQPHVAAVARGVLQHLRDDQWFHETRAFVELSLELTRRTRDFCGQDPSMRPSFVGHILVELLLDHELAQQSPGLLDQYYAVLRGLDTDLVREAVDRFANRPSQNLPLMIARFCEDPFLYDYAEDGKLLWRVNRVMQRVGLPELPESVRELLPDARFLVRQRITDLLRGESE